MFKEIKKSYQKGWSFEEDFFTFIHMRWGFSWTPGWLYFLGLYHCGVCIGKVSSVHYNCFHFSCLPSLCTRGHTCLHRVSAEYARYPDTLRLYPLGWLIFWLVVSLCLFGIWDMGSSQVVRSEQDDDLSLYSQDLLSNNHHAGGHSKHTVAEFPVFTVVSNRFLDGWIHPLSSGSELSFPLIENRFFSCSVFWIWFSLPQLPWDSPPLTFESTSFLSL